MYHVNEETRLVQIRPSSSTLGNFTRQDSQSANLRALCNQRRIQRHSSPIPHPFLSISLLCQESRQNGKLTSILLLCDCVAATSHSQGPRTDNSSAQAIKHNNIIPNTHFHKDWQRRVKVHFEQAGRKHRRRDARIAKAARVAPRPVDRLRPVVQCPTLKYNRRARAGRGFTIQELKVR